MSRTADGDGADGGEHGETTDGLPDEEPESTADEETDDATAAESEVDPAERRCGITLGEK